MIIHVKYFLLLCCELLILSCSGITSGVHNSESHTSWYKNVSTLRIIRRDDGGFNHVVVIICCVDSTVDSCRMLVAVVSHVSAVGTGSDSAFLVVAVQLLDVEASTAVVISKLSSTRSWFKRLILCSSSTLGMQVLSEIVLWRLYRANDILCSSTASALIAYLSMCHVKMVNVILLVIILLSVVLVFKDFSEDSFSIAVDLIISLE